MRVTVCELTNDPELLELEWTRLCAHVTESESDLVVLPEMPFSPWLAASPTKVPEEWGGGVVAHTRWIARLGELGADVVVSTRPVIEGAENYNQGFVWTKAGGVALPVHKKRYLPDEPGFWEASWYSPGDRDFAPHDVDFVRLDSDASHDDVGSARIGFAICTEIWFQQHAREYGKLGVQLLLCPRATLMPSVDKWIAGGRSAAVVSGAFCLSSNLAGPATDLGDWGGAGWVVEPEEGDVLGVTSRERPFLTLEIDLGVSDTAKTTYPRYVLD